MVTTVNVHLGYGSHAAVVKQNGGQSLLEEVLLINFFDFALGIMAFATPKLAIASLLNRIMNPGKFHRVWLWVLTGLVFVASSICIIVLFTMCDPPKAMWQIHLMATGATCRPIEILVGYAIFTGGMSPSAYWSYQTDEYCSILCVRRPVPRDLLDSRIDEAPDVAAGETGAMCDIGARRSVSSCHLEVSR